MKRSIYIFSGTGLWNQYKNWDYMQKKNTYLSVDLLKLWVVLVHLEIQLRRRYWNYSRSDDSRCYEFSFRANIDWPCENLRKLE